MALFADDIRVVVGSNGFTAHSSRVVMVLQPCELVCAECCHHEESDVYYNTAVFYSKDLLGI